MPKLSWMLVLLVFAALVASAQIPNPDRDGVYRAGNDVDPPRLMQAVPAVFPTDPQLAGIKHGSTFEVVFGADGVPTKFQVIGEPSAPFDEAAVAAIRQSHFSPGKAYGNPIPVKAYVWVPFIPGSKPPTPEVFPLEGGTSPVFVSGPDVKYTGAARHAKLQGMVVVLITVTEDGQTTDFQVTQELGMGLDHEALAAVSQFKFKPATKYGLPIRSRIYIQFNFRLN